MASPPPNHFTGCGTQPPHLLGVDTLNLTVTGCEKPYLNIYWVRLPYTSLLLGVKTHALTFTGLLPYTSLLLGVKNPTFTLKGVEP